MKYCLSLLLVLFTIGHANEHKSPILATSAIIEIYELNEFKGIVLIDRAKAPIGKALPGGKVEYGESVQDAVRREMLEEVSLTLEELELFYVYSAPDRDPRFHVVDVVHVAKAYALPTPGDDAARAYVIPLEDIPWDKLVFDHAQILRDYISWRHAE